MKILAFSDIHRDVESLIKVKRRFNQVDLIVFCGDLVDFGIDFHRVASIINGVDKPLLIVPGNNETVSQVNSAAREYGWINLHQATYEAYGFMFAGVGGSTITPFNTPFEMSEVEFEEILGKFVGRKNLILVTHSPPYGTLLDETTSGMHVGSKAVRRFIEENRPLLNLCGHIHEQAGKEDRIGGTRIVNVGKRGVILKI